MKTVRGYQDLKQEDRGASAAIGNFDGVHRGHQAVLDLARDAADRLHCPLGIITFDPHPREFFAPDAPPFQLMNAEAMRNRLRKLGVARLHELPFDAGLAGLSAHDFAARVLAEGLGVRHVVVGADFRFGKRRSGSAEDLQRLGAEFGFGVTIAELLEFEGVGRVSSTLIRKALSDGRPGDAAAMLGHWHRIEGPVLHGAKRGRDFGYPTANLAIDGLHLPKQGVYAVLVDILDGPHRGSHRGVASLGVRPMFGENRPNLEVHIFDFDADLYGRHISVAFVEYLRPEARFDGIDRLITQMRDDSRQAREILERV